ncbi:efflux transporter outer membrane subunit [Aurantiacibacter rhizosphaerae]|uniref:Efflux transporter outer membrane subunit n=1 Tax=Aurantiacibacter rhizosphaerae TaxID=2691582 RepID=A0A844XBC6_9SPHN|nr:efflux transporter outer membrane subunit [Aurantiacibacter rhizosphaerae]MWV27140.1 efflux transporter outer membrane subunit [Aurantiacibacter rhizosphaerae]
MTRKITAGVLALSVATALAGCVNMAPDHDRPALSTPAAYDADYRPDGAVVAASLSYREWFVDPRLVALVDSALANNRDLLAATARIEQARAQYRIEDSRKLPTLVASAAAARSRTPLSSVSPGADGSITANRFDVGVGVSAFELDFWGRIANLSDAARAQFLAAQANQRAFYLSLIADVSTTYFELVETEAQLALAEATLQSRQEELRLAKRRLDAGVTSALPYRQAETLLTTAEQQVATFRLARARLGNQLAVLVGGSVPADLPAGLPLVQQDNGMVLDAGTPSHLMLVRPDILAAEEQLRAARANIGAARAAFFPAISLTGSAGFASSQLDGLFGGNGLTWSFGPSISLPIFDWGAREANLDLARAREVEQFALYDKAVQTAFREVSDGLAGRRWLADQVTALQRGVTAQEKIARLAGLRYREGVANYLEVLDAERNLFAARQQLLTTQRAYLQNGATLFVALGGGTGGGGIG